MHSCKNGNSCMSITLLNIKLKPLIVNVPQRVHKLFSKLSKRASDTEKGFQFMV